jgi:hypothetical protein
MKGEHYKCMQQEYSTLPTWLMGNCCRSILGHTKIASRYARIGLCLLDRVRHAYGPRAAHSQPLIDSALTEEGVLFTLLTNGTREPTREKRSMTYRITAKEVHTSFWGLRE